MPSTSKKQHNFMAAVANNPAFAKKVGVPQSVGQDFNKADKGRKFSKGGDMASKMNPGFMAMMAKKKGMQEGSKADKASDKKQMMGMKSGGMHKMPDGKMMKDSAMKKMASGGMTSALAKHAGKPASKAHAGLKDGGMPMVMKDGKKIPAFAADGEGKMKKGGGVNKKVSGMGYSSGGAKKMMGGGMGYSIGGGIESRGKTKGKII